MIRYLFNTPRIGMTVGDCLVILIMTAILLITLSCSSSPAPDEPIFDILRIDVSVNEGDVLIGPEAFKVTDSLEKLRFIYHAYNDVPIWGCVIQIYDDEMNLRVDHNWKFDKPLFPLSDPNSEWFWALDLLFTKGGFEPGMHTVYLWIYGEKIKSPIWTIDMVVYE